MIWFLFIALAIISFVLGVRYERQRQQRLRIDYVNAMGAMWGKYKMMDETDDDFRLRLVRSVMDLPNVKCQDQNESGTHRTAGKVSV